MSLLIPAGFRLSNQIQSLANVTVPAGGGATLSTASTFKVGVWLSNLDAVNPVFIGNTTLGRGIYVPPLGSLYLETSGNVSANNPAGAGVIVTVTNMLVA